MKQFTAGYAQMNISPMKRVAGRLGINHMIEPYQNIFTKAMALCSENEKYLIIVCEIVGLTKSENNAIRVKIAESVDIEYRNIIITGTHTHASPWVWDVQDDEARKRGFEVLDRKWMNKLITNTAAAGIEAIKNLKPSKVKYGIAKTKGIASNRVSPVTRWSICSDEKLRNAPKGVVDEYVRTISIHDENDLPIVIYSNLACHPSAYGGGKTTKISPDFPYAAERYLKDKYGSRFSLAYWQGCAGNINSGKYVELGSVDEVEAIGRRFGKAVAEAVASAREISGFEYKYKKFTLPVGDFVKSPDDAAKRFDEICREMKEKEVMSDSDVFLWRSILKQLDVSLLSQGKEMEMEMQLFKFEELDLLFVPGEWYVQIYKNLAKNNRNRNLIITTLNNFDLLYIPDEDSMEHKDWYGVKTGMRSLGNDSAVKLYEKALEILS